MSKSSKNTPAYSSLAGGRGALKSSAKYLIHSENAFKRMKAILKANQPGGFDCPGCAWGDSASASKIVEYSIPLGCVAAYYPETNPLVPLESVADDCATPTYKSIPVSVEKIEQLT